MSHNLVALAIGKKGSGKTTYLREHVARSRRALIVDPEIKWPLLEADTEVRTAAQLLRHLHLTAGAFESPAAPFRVVYRDDADRLALVAPQVAFALRNCTLVIDELAWLTDAHHLPTYLARILQFGRERRVNLLGTTREPVEIHNWFFPTADVLAFFQMDPGNGLDRIRRRYGEEIANRLPGFKTGESILYGNPAVFGLIGAEGLLDRPGEAPRFESMPAVPSQPPPRSPASATQPAKRRGRPKKRRV